MLPHEKLTADIEQIDLRGHSVSPGFIDLQVNGGGDRLFNDSPTADQVRAIRDAHLRFGTTDLLVTYITGPSEGMRAAAAAVAESMAPDNGILGIHFEGPAINPERAGVHDLSFIRSAPEDELLEIYGRLGERTLVTLAPEMVSPGFVAKIAAAGARVAIGHSVADFATVVDAIEQGARGGTHVWNAMSPMTNRNPGTVGALLRDDRVWCGFIADGYHVDFDTLLVTLRAKSPRRAFLATDAMSPVGGETGGYRLGSYDVRVVDGRCQTADGTLAGSALDMASAVRNLIQKMGVPKQEALRMATLYPAEFMRLGGRFGSIAAGRVAHLAVFDNEINVSMVVRGDTIIRVT